MADTIYTSTLERAARTQESTQALASLLNVPEGTLLRWMSGRAQMPLRAFLRLIQVVAEHEKACGESESPRGAETRPAKFRAGPLEARCARCDGVDFLGPDVARYTSTLACASCGERVVHGDLIARLATEAVQHSRALTVQRIRRQGGIRPASAKPQVRNEPESGGK